MSRILLLVTKVYLKAAGYRRDGDIADEVMNFAARFDTATGQQEDFLPAPTSHYVRRHGMAKDKLVQQEEAVALKYHRSVRRQFF